MQALTAMLTLAAFFASVPDVPAGPKRYTPGSTPPKPARRLQPAPLPAPDPDALARAMSVTPHETRAQRRERMFRGVA